MSLKTFHLFFITISAALSVLMIDLGSGGLVGTSGIILLVLLVPYSVWFMKKAKKLVIAISVIPSILVIHANIGWTCSVCFGDPNSLMSQSAKKGVLFLGVVVVGVLASICGIAFSWAKRARQLSVNQSA